VIGEYEELSFSTQFTSSFVVRFSNPVYMDASGRLWLSMDFPEML
jgi:hypothetical protein